MLTEVSFPPGEEVWKLRAVGDLDGDGFEDFLFYKRFPRENDRPLVYSSGTWEPLDVAPGWRLSWAAACGDLDGDGLDDLVLGRVAPWNGEQRLSIYSRAGLRDVRTVPSDEIDWARVGVAHVGRFRDSGPWFALLAVLPEIRSRAGGTVAIVPGA